MCKIKITVASNDSLAIKLHYYFFPSACRLIYLYDRTLFVKLVNLKGFFGIATVSYFGVGDTGWRVWFWGGNSSVYNCLCYYTIPIGKVHL